MKNIFYLIILCFNFSFSQNTFQKIYGRGNGYSVQQTTDSGYVVFGSNYPLIPGNAIDICVLKTNQIGDTLWIRTLDFADYDVARSGLQTMDVGFLLTGSIGIRPFLIRLNANGDTLWSKLIYGSPGVGSGKSIIQTIDGGFIFTGQTDNPASGMMLIKLDSAGTILWYKSYTHLGYDDAGRCVIQTSDLGYLIVGNSESSHGSLNSIIIKTDINGDTLWTKEILNYGYGSAASCIETYDGNYVIAGTTLVNINSSENTYLVKLDTAGNLLWSKWFGNSDSTLRVLGNSILQTVDSGIVVTGIYNNSQGMENIFLFKTNSVGDTLWTRYYYSASYSEPFSIKQANDNGFIISGSLQDSSNSGTFIYLIKTDSLGHTDCNEFIPSIVLDTFSVITQYLPTNISNIANTEQLIFPNIGYSVQAIDYCSVNYIASINNTSIKIFPNPASNYLTFVFPPNNHSHFNAINYYNLIGELVYTEPINFQPGDSEVISDISILHPGVYIARIYGNVNYQIMIIKQ